MSASSRDAACQGSWRRASGVWLPKRRWPCSAEGGPHLSRSENGTQPEWFLTTALPPTFTCFHPKVEWRRAYVAEQRVDIITAPGWAFPFTSGVGRGMRVVGRDYRTAVGGNRRLTCRRSNWRGSPGWRARFRSGHLRSPQPTTAIPAKAISVRNRAFRGIRRRLPAAVAVPWRRKHHRNPRWTVSLRNQRIGRRVCSAQFAGSYS